LFPPLRQVSTNAQRRNVAEDEDEEEEVEEEFSK
jgi:hypothetical protein